MGVQEWRGTTDPLWFNYVRDRWAWYVRDTTHVLDHPIPIRFFCTGCSHHVMDHATDGTCLFGPGRFVSSDKALTLRWVAHAEYRQWV